MTSRIRCSCGRVYDPSKHVTCPECGAESPVESVVVAEKAKAIDPTGSPPPVRPNERATEPPPPLPVPLLSRPGLAGVPWLVLAGAGILILLIALFAFGRRSSAPNEASKERVAPPDHQDGSPSAGASEAPPPPAQFPTPGSAIAMNGRLADMVASTPEGGTIKLRAGLYQGGAIITRPVRIIADSQSTGQAFIQSDTREVLAIRTKGVVLQNVQVMFNGTGEVAALAVADNSEVEMDGCKITSTSSYALQVNGHGSLKATASTLTGNNGVAARFDHQSVGTFTKCNFTDAPTALDVQNGSTIELHACLFERVGAQNGRGAIISASGEKSTVTAEDCRFSSNPAGITISAGAVLSVANSAFKDNGVAYGQGNWLNGIVQIKSGGSAKLTHDEFETNSQGIAAVNGGHAEIMQCQFVGNGLQTRGQFITACQAISSTGDSSQIVVKETSITGTASYAVAALWGAHITLEETEISGATTVGLLIGDRNGLPASGEAKHCHVTRNNTGAGTCAGSSLTISDSELRENSVGAMALDKGTHLNMVKTSVVGNREHGVYVYGGAEGEVTDCQLENNSRGAQSGQQRKSSMAGILTLQNCRVAGNQTFGVGACAKSQLTLNQVTFDANGKTNVYRETGAIVQNDSEEPPNAQASNDESSPDQSPGETTHSGTRHRKSHPQQNSDDPRRVIRRLFHP